MYSSFIQLLNAICSVFVQSNTEQILNKYWTSTEQMIYQGGDKQENGASFFSGNNEINFASLQKGCIFAAE